MKEIKDFYNELGEEFLQKILNSELKVTEKLTGTKFGFKKSGDSINFYRRDKRSPLGPIDRTLSSLYENPISYISSLDLSNIPDDVYFFFEYFYNNKPLSVKYDNLPKNGLILSCVMGLDKQDVNSINSETSTLTKWSKALGTDMPRVYFNGLLSEEQKEMISDFVKTDSSDLLIKFDTKSFSKHIIKILNPRLRKTTLNKDIEKSIEGFIFQFTGDEKTYTAKTIDPIFTQMQLQNRREKISNDEIGLLLYRFIEWLNESNKLNTITTSGDNSDEKYLDIMSKLVSMFIEDNNTFIKDIDIKKPTFAILPEFRLNPKFIKNKKIQEFITNNSEYSDIYKILISSFRKERKKTTQIIDETLKKYINNYVRLIKLKTNETITESYMTFSEWKKFKKQ
jgi:hypothetical protein